MRQKSIALRLTPKIDRDPVSPSPPAECAWDMDPALCFEVQSLVIDAKSLLFQSGDLLKLYSKRTVWFFLFHTVVVFHCTAEHDTES